MPVTFKRDQLKQPFSKGLIQDKGVQLVPEEYSVKGKNFRCINGTTTSRDGFETLSNDMTLSTKIVRNLSAATYLYAVINKKLWKVDTVDGGLTWLDTSAFVDDVKEYSTVFGQYVIFCDGMGYPYLYDETTDTFTHLGSGAIESGANPRFGASFAFGTYLAGGDDNKTALYASRGITATHPEYAYDWVGTGAEKIRFKGEIKGLVSTLSRLFIFTTVSIEFISTQSLATIGGNTVTYSTPIAGDNVPASPGLCVAADDRVFFWTIGNRCKTLNYIPGITEVQVGDLTNRPNQGLEDLISTLDTDQSGGMAYYNKEKKLVFFCLRTAGEQFNNVRIVYDPTYDTFYYDTGIFYGTEAKLGTTYYTGSDANQTIYIDGIAKDDDGQPISWERWLPRLSLSSPNFRKEFREVTVFGEIDNITVINMDVYVDDAIVFTGQFTQSSRGIAGLASRMIGSAMIGGEFPPPNTRKPFTKNLTYTNLRSRGKNIQLVFRGQQAGGDFCLSGAEIGYYDLGDADRRDKF